MTSALPDFDARIVTVSPSATPSAETAGVLSFVRLSVDDEPVSDDATKSGVPAFVAVSMLSGSGVDAGEVLPARSVCVAATLHVPSASVGRSHDVSGRTYEHETGVDPSFVAVIVTRSPLTAPTGVADMVGVLSFVMLSVDEVPVSEAAARSTAVGAAGAVRSIVIVVPVAAAPGPVPPDAGTTEPDASCGMTVPSPQLEAVTVKVVVDTDVMANVQPVEVPEFVMSAAVSDAASIADEKTSV